MIIVRKFCGQHPHFRLYEKGVHVLGTWSSISIFVLGILSIPSPWYRYFHCQTQLCLQIQAERYTSVSRCHRRMVLWSFRSHQSIRSSQCFPRCKCTRRGGSRKRASFHSCATHFWNLLDSLTVNFLTTMTMTWCKNMITATVRIHFFVCMATSRSNKRSFFFLIRPLPLVALYSYVGDNRFNICKGFVRVVVSLGAGVELLPLPYTHH